MKRILKLVFLTIVILSVFLIYKSTNNKYLNYTSIGDGLSKGIDSYGNIDYGYSDYVKDYLKDIEEEFKMTNLKYSEAIRRVEKRGYKYQDEFRDAIDNLYPVGHELVHIDMVDEAIDEAAKKSERGE